jgi:hypothetical protein
MPVLNENLARLSRGIFKPELDLSSFRTPPFNPSDPLPTINPKITMDQRQSIGNIDEIVNVPTERDLYQQDTRATDAFFDLMKQVPERKEPGFGRRLVAGLSSLGPEGSAGAERIKYGPYMRQLEDFKLRADLLKDLSSAERSGNINERMMLSQILRSDIAEKGLEERERSSRAREVAEVSRQSTREQEAETRARAAESLSEYRRIQTRLAQIREDKTLSDTQKAALGAKYAQDLENLRQGGRITLAGEQAELAQDLERLRQEGDIETVKARGAEERKTEAEKAEIKTEKGELPTQTKVRQYNRARQIFNTDPESKQFIRLGSPGTNDFTIKMPTAFRAETKEAYRKKYEELNQQIYGSNWREQNPGESVVKEGTVFVRDPKTGKLIKK